MATVIQLATGARMEGVEGALLAYYQGEAATVGGYSIDGVEYPEKVDVPVTEDEVADAFDPGEHNVDEVLEYLADATPEEQQRVLAAEAEGKNRKSLLEA